MPLPLPPYCNREHTRHGKTVIYVRPFWHGQRIRIRAEEGTDEFWNQYRAAMEKGSATGPKPRDRQNLEWAIDRYRASAAWRGLKPATRRQRENIYLAVVKTAGEESLADIDQATIRVGRERRKEKVHSANNFLKAMRGLFG
jgi:hypothetical protein